MMKKQFNKSHLQQLKSTAGFTLIEIMIVMTLIGVILGLMAKNFMGKQREGYVKAAKIQIQQVKQALDDYYRACGQYPSDAQGGLKALAEPPSDGNCKDYEPMFKKVPKDPWGTDFIYFSEDGRNVVLKSLGSDRREGGEGDAKDISLEDVEK